MGDNSFAGINFNDPESKSIFKNQEKMRCSRWNDNNISMFIENVKVLKLKEYAFKVEGRVSGVEMNQLLHNKVFVKYVAPNPPTYLTSFSGSGLPYPNETIAFDNTPNKGVVEVINGHFSLTLKYPNSYYNNMGTVYVQPNVKLVVVNDKNHKLSEPQEINLGEGIPFRTLTWPRQRNWNNGPLFYDVQNLPVRTQYEILLQSAYPKTNTMPTNFWGLDPPH
jgi:hypothetical protein